MKTRKIPCIAAIGLTILSITACQAKINGKEQAEGIKTQNALGQEEQQLEFEEEYIKGKYSYAEGGKFAVAIITNLGNIAGGIGFDSPASAVAGLMGLITACNDQFAGSQGPTIADVMNKLAEIEERLDQINQTLDKNYNELMSETIRTQAMVDQVLLEEMEAAISNFNTDYVVPIENHKRDYSDYIEQNYKTFVNKNETVEIHIEKTEDNQYALIPLIDMKDGQDKITFEITEFANAKQHLEKNYNVVTNGFMDNFYQDIDIALENVILPNGLNKETCRNYVAANIVERFTQQYYINNHQKALDLRNMVINYAKQINGKAVKSIVDRYVTRFEYMYNFVGEMKTNITNLFANIMYGLDINTALAAQACMYAETNQDEIRTEFLAAKELIQNYYTNIQALDDRYCFVTNTIVGGTFNQAKFTTNYNNKGNNCTFRATLEYYKVTSERDVKFIEDNMNNHNYLDQIDHMRIVTRMNLMKKIGLTQATTYVDYLVNANVVEKNAYAAYKTLIQRNWITNDALRFFTGVTIRAMTENDNNFNMECVDVGNPDGDYFNIGWKGTYRSKKTAGCWSGKIAETTFIDANTGKTMNDKRVAAYATYNESHWYWIDDEHWAFVDNKVGNYFFTLENLTA